MQTFLLSLHSEFYKTRKTLAFLSAVLLPTLLCTLIFTGFYLNADKLIPLPAAAQWMRYTSPLLGVMGTLILPILVIFQAYSVNSIEHKAEMWKSLFSQPLPKLSLYGSKFVYLILLNALCLGLLATLLLSSAWLMNLLVPKLKFNQYDFGGMLFKIHVKLFLSSIGILSIQFLLSLLWEDFLKPMGVGFILTIAGIITASVGWKYAYTIPYSHPLLALDSAFRTMKEKSNGALTFDLMSKEIYVSLAVAVITFIAGYYVISKRSIK